MTDWLLDKIAHCAYLVDTDEPEMKNNWSTLEAGDKNLILKLSKEARVLTLRHGDDVLQLWDFGQAKQSVRVFKQKASLLLIKKIKNTIYKCRILLKGEGRVQACTELFQELKSFSDDGETTIGQRKNSTVLSSNRNNSENYKDASQMSPSLLESLSTDVDPVSTHYQDSKKENNCYLRGAFCDETVVQREGFLMPEYCLSKNVISNTNVNQDLDSASRKHSGGESPLLMETHIRQEFVTNPYFTTLESQGTTYSSSQPCKSNKGVLELQKTTNFSSSSNEHIRNRSKEDLSQTAKLPSSSVNCFEVKRSEVQALTFGLSQQQEDPIEVVAVVEPSENNKPRRRRKKQYPKSRHMMNKIGKSTANTERTEFEISNFRNEYTKATLASIPDDTLKQMVRQCLLDPQLPEMVSKIHHIISHY